MAMLSASTAFVEAGGVAGSTAMDVLDAARDLPEAGFMPPAPVALGVADDELAIATVLFEPVFASVLLLSVFAVTVDREDFSALGVVCTAFVAPVEPVALVADAGECVIGWSPARLGADSALGCSWLATLLEAATELLFSATAGVGFLVELALLAILRSASGNGFDFVAF